MSIVYPLLQQVVRAVELLAQRLRLGLRLTDGLLLEVYEGLFLRRRLVRPFEAIIVEPAGKSLQQPLLHDVVLSTDVVAGTVGTHERTAVSIGPEGYAAATLPTDQQPGQRVGDSVARLDGRRAFLSKEVLGL